MNFAHLQVFHTFLHVFSDTETTKPETKRKSGTLAVNCQTTRDIALETAKKHLLPAHLFEHLLCLPGQYQGSFTEVPQGAGGAQWSACAVGSLSTQSQMFPPVPGMIA